MLLTAQPLVLKASGKQNLLIVFILAMSCVFHQLHVKFQQFHVKEIVGEARRINVFHQSLEL